MPVLKYSKQRECIREYLQNTKSHPSADMVYDHVRKQYPTISLGTVYRNLRLLEDIGSVIKIPTPDGGDRYDACTENHYHVVCSDCGAVEDISMDTDFFKSVNKFAADHYFGEITSHHTLFSGRCKECVRKRKKYK